MKRKILFFLFLVISNTILFAQSDFQKGYIQITEHDTIFGLINYKSDISNHLVCQFKKSENDTVHKFYPNEIFGYRFLSSKYYVSKDIESKDSVNFFVEYLVRGTLNLFFYRDKVGDHYLIQKPSLKLKEISYTDKIIYQDEITKFRQSMINRPLVKYYMQDCPELFSDIDKIKNASHLELMNLVNRYHEIVCPNDVCIIYKKNLPKFRMFLQPVFGTANFATYDFSQTNYAYQFGLLSYIWLPLTNERVYFKTGILFFKMKQLDYNSNNSYRYYNSFRIPLQVQYIFLKHKISPTFGGGFDMISTDIQMIIIPAINAGINWKISDSMFFSLCSEINYSGILFILPIPKNDHFLISNSFNFGLTIKL